MGTILPARTGSVSTSRNDVTRTAHTNSGILYIVCPGARILNTVTIKFIAPSIDEIPER